MRYVCRQALLLGGHSCQDGTEDETTVMFRASSVSTKVTRARPGRARSEALCGVGPSADDWSKCSEFLRFVLMEDSLASTRCLTIGLVTCGKDRLPKSTLQSQRHP